MSEKKRIYSYQLLFPLLAILGMRIMNGTSNNVALMVLLLMIPGYTIFLAVRAKKVPETIYGPVIFLFSVSLVLLLALRSNYIVGYDIHDEYYIFQQTLQHGLWQPVTNNALDSCLSISILPTIYQSFLNINSEYLFKILYPLLFSISPLIVYLIARQYLNAPRSFLAAVFFMSQYVFLNAELDTRAIVAILFFALSILILFYKELRSFDRYLLFIIFSTSVVFSHYSTAYIFLFVLVLTWLIVLLVQRVILRGRNTSPITKIMDPENRLVGKPKHSYHIPFGLVIFYLIILYIWDGIVSKTALQAALEFISTTIANLKDFFSISSRGTATTVLGSGLKFPQQITFIAAWLTIIFVAIGEIIIIIRSHQTIAIDNANKESMPKFLTRKFDIEFFILSLACCMILVIAVALPYILEGYDVDRVYGQAMIILSPFFIIGGITIANAFKKFMVKDLGNLIILLVLVLYYMCTTGVMNQLVGVPSQIIINSSGQDYDYEYVHDQEAYAAEWMGDFASKTAVVYSDWYGTDRLISPGGNSFCDLREIFDRR